MTLTVFLIVIIAALLACALTPPEVKARNPRVWLLLESLAVNVGKAANAVGPKGNGTLAALAYAVALGGAFLAQTTSSLPATVPAPPAAVTFVAVLPADPTAAALAVAVSPAADVTP